MFLINYILLINFIILFNFNYVFSIPILKDTFNNIKLYDFRELFTNEYNITSTNFETNDFIDFITPYPLIINKDIYCEKNLNEYIEVLIINCHIWNKFNFYLNEYYDYCLIKKNIKIFGKTIEFTEKIRLNC